MKTMFKSVVGAAVCALCGCSGMNDGATSDGASPGEAALGRETSALAAFSGGIAQGYRGDFNADGIEDIILATSTGSAEYLGQTTGGFSPVKWFRSDLPLGQVHYTIGDFNKDGYSDLIATTSSGSVLLTGRAGGGFNTSSWLRSDLTYASVAFHAGDFNGDNASDVLITTSAGSFLYLGVPGGTLRDSGWSASWPLTGYDFAVGDFNNDTRSDLIVASASGAAEYLGVIGGSFYQATWPGGSSFPSGSHFYPGDYNGDKSWDLIAQNLVGSYELHGQSGVDGGFSGPFWSDTTLPVNQNAFFVPGDFNGDGKWDVVIAEGTGSYLYLGRAGTSGITGAVWQNTNLASYHSAFLAGNFRGGPGNNAHPTALIVTNDTSGTDEYLGQAGTTTGGFSTGFWVHPGLVTGNSHFD